MYYESGRGSIFGESVFGDPVYAMDASQSRAVGGLGAMYAVRGGFGAPLIPQPGHAYPVRDNQAIRQELMPLIPVSKVHPASLPIRTRPIPAGSMYKVGGRLPVTTVLPQELVVAQGPPAGFPIGGKIETYNGERRYFPHAYPHRPGVFHRPPYAGAYRYELPHSFGPPTISGYGAGPDGLSGLVGMGD